MVESRGPVVNHFVPPVAARFHTTSWSRVLRAGSAEDAESRPALTALCQAYWYPLYAFLRRQGLSPADAEDVVQAFFSRLLEDRILRYVDPARGRFRGFLLAALRQFLAGRREHESAAKRKPPGTLEPIETADGEVRYARELTDHVTPEVLYNYAWAVALLKRAIEALRDEYEVRGLSRRFEAFQGLLTGQSDRSARELGEELGLSEGPCGSPSTG